MSAASPAATTTTTTTATRPPSRPARLPLTVPACPSFRAQRGISSYPDHTWVA
ncbi:MAG: hypothetical protein LBK18_00725 [Prevotellaceae bacterium]|nr:hypothetical protein [Prevotellaceae bacterium]